MYTPRKKTMCLGKEHSKANVGVMTRRYLTREVAATQSYATHADFTDTP